MINFVVSGKKEIKRVASLEIVLKAWGVVKCSKQILVDLEAFSTLTSVVSVPSSTLGSFAFGPLLSGW